VPSLHVAWEGDVGAAAVCSLAVAPGPAAPAALYAGCEDGACLVYPLPLQGGAPARGWGWGGVRATCLPASHQLQPHLQGFFLSRGK